MFLSEEKLEVTQISLTGTRALALIGLLIIEPRTFEEIKAAFIDMGIFSENNSDDILRIDLNTIKKMGCELSRPCLSNGYKYSLKKHPFSLTLNKDDVKLLKRAYMKVKDSSNIETLLAYDDLFRKIADHVYDEEIKEQLLGISILKYYNVNELKELYLDCQTKKTLELIYKSLEMKKDVPKKIRAEKIFFQNDKLYLCGYDCNIEKTTVLLYKRIKTIISRKFEEKLIKTTDVVISFILKDLENETLNENEYLVSSDERGNLIKGVYFNEFFAIQRILSFGPKCIVIEPIEIRNKVIEKLKEMKEVYNG